MSSPTSRTIVTAAALTLILAGCSTTPKNTAPPPAPAPKAAAPAPMPAKAAAPAPAPAMKYVIEGVHFDTDQSTLKTEAMATLDKAAAALQKQPGVKYEVAGYADTTGAEPYNQGLSERRAQAVQDYLVSKGVAPGQLTTKGYGEGNPAAANNTSKGRAKNRRVEIWPKK